MTKNRKWFASLAVAAGILLIVLVLAQSSRVQAAPALAPMEMLGKKFLFFDKNLSKNGNQSCATCHDPSVGYTGPDSAINAHGTIYPGSDPDLFGNRNPLFTDFSYDNLVC